MVLPMVASKWHLNIYKIQINSPKKNSLTTEESIKEKEEKKTPQGHIQKTSLSTKCKENAHFNIT